MSENAVLPSRPRRPRRLRRISSLRPLQARDYNVSRMPDLVSRCCARRGWSRDTAKATDM